MAYFPFNGNADDESGTGNDGTVTGADLTTDRFKVSNKAYEFNGSTDYIIKTSPVSMPSGNGVYTITLWAMFHSIGGGQHRIVLGMGDIESTKRVLAITTQASGSNNLWVAHWGADWDTGFTLSLNTWYHFAVEYNGTNEKLYVNGEYYAQGGSNTFNLSPDPLVIGGSDFYDPLPNGPFDGKVDDVRIYTRVLSTDEITEIYNEPRTYTTTTTTTTTCTTTSTPPP